LGSAWGEVSQPLCIPPFDAVPAVAIIRGSDAMMEITFASRDRPESNVGDPSDTRRAATIVSNESSRHDVTESKASACLSIGKAEMTVHNAAPTARRSSRVMTVLSGLQESFQMSER
jgi:hypothetical protein